MLIRYDGPAHRLLLDGRAICRGETQEFTQSEAFVLITQPHTRLTVVGMEGMTRAEIAAAIAEPEAHTGEGQAIVSTDQEE